MLRYVVCVTLLCGFSKQQAYEVPPATVEILHPKGFTVSIPDGNGIKLVAFHIKINKEFDGREIGDYAEDIRYPENGWWTFRDFSERFQPGDVIHYWILVQYFDGTRTLDYVKEHQKFVVDDIPKNNANKGNKGNKGNQGNKGNKGNKGNQGNQDHGGYYPTPSTASTVPISACDYSPSKINGQSTCSGQVLFEENFDEVNGNKWQREIKFADDPDYEFVIYGVDNGNLNTGNGQLHIKPTFAEDRYGIGFVTIPGGLDLGLNCTGVPNTLECKQEPVAFLILPPALSARINTKPSFSFLYGRVDVRAKLPKGDWIYPELFLSPKKYEYGSQGYASGEIRIAFLPGNTNFDKELEGGVILGTSDEARKFGLRKLKSASSWSDDFHVFSIVWKPDSIQVLVDDHIYANILPPPGGFANVASKYNPEAAAKWKNGETIAPFDKEMVITVGVGVGGHSFPDSLPGKPYTNTDGKAQLRFYKAKDSWLSTWNQNSVLIVDYIKVYAL